jgi:DNA processing protein
MGGLTRRADLASDLIARVALAQIVEPGDERIGAWVARTDAATVVEEMCANPGAVRIPNLTSAAAEVERSIAAGLELVVPGSSGWPTQLDDLGPAGPLLLWISGSIQLRPAAIKSVAVVGARAATGYGVRVAANLGAELAAAGWCVVSGGAYGIDAAAHRGSLAAGGPTVAVVASGVDVAYPRGHEDLFTAVVASGALISEVPLGSSPRRLRFLVRNRVIAALTRGTVVVEAALRSGALGTAHYAERLGRVVMGVPGPIDSFMSAGVHRELRAGALLVTSAAEIVEAVGALGVDLAPELIVPARPRDKLPPAARLLLDAFPARGPAQPADLAGDAGVAAGVLPAILHDLARAGLVRRTDAGWSLTPRGRA